MTTFTYTALDAGGRQVTGTIPADNRTVAMDKIISQGLAPVSLNEQASARASAASARPAKPPTRVSAVALEGFTRELANLLAAGLPLSRALHLLQREASQLSAKYIWSTIHEDVVGGMALADAMAKWPRVFSDVYVAMIRAGEAGGFLPIALQQIADFRTRERDLLGKVKAALVYPCVLAVLAVGVLVFLLTFFIPRFAGIFAEFGSNLPTLTRVIVAASEALMNYGLFLLALVVVAIVLGRRMAGTESGRRFVERVVLRIPLAGAVVARFALVRFSRMLGTLLGAGVPLVNSLQVSRHAMGNQTLSDTVAHAVDEVRRGEPLSRSLMGNYALFPPAVIEMISVAEETGRLDKELLRLSAAYEGDLDRQLRMLVALAEPLLLFLMAGLIGTVVVGMLLPVFNIQDLIK